MKCYAPLYSSQNLFDKKSAMLESSLHSQAVIALSVLSSSFLGSVHCLGMCGPIVMITNKSSSTSFMYHIGRLISYLLLGLFAGLIGQELLGFFPRSIAALLAPLVLGLTFIYIGIMLYRKQRFHMPLPKLFSRPYANVVAGVVKEKRQSIFFSLMIGLLSITLPCGWLYGFVIGAAATKSITTSVMIMFMFWLGTIPALLITPIVFQKIIGPFKNKFPTIASLTLLIAGIFIIVVGISRTL